MTYCSSEKVRTARRADEDGHNRDMASPFGLRGESRHFFGGAGRKVVIAGDGINDAPTLTAADVGMGARGSDAALERAEVILMDDKIDKGERSRALKPTAHEGHSQLTVLSDFVRRY